MAWLGCQSSAAERAPRVHALLADRLAVAGAEARHAQLADHPLGLEHVHQLAHERRAAAAGALGAPVVRGRQAAAKDLGGELARHVFLFGARPPKPSCRSLRAFFGANAKERLRQVDSSLSSARSSEEREWNG